MVVSGELFPQRIVAYHIHFFKLWQYIPFHFYQLSANSWSCANTGLFTSQVNNHFESLCNRSSLFRSALSNFMYNAKCLSFWHNTISIPLLHWQVLLPMQQCLHLFMYRNLKVHWEIDEDAFSIEVFFSLFLNHGKMTHIQAHGMIWNRKLCRNTHKN